MGRFVISGGESGHPSLSLFFFTTKHAMPAQRVQSRGSKKAHPLLPPQTSVNSAAHSVCFVLKTALQA
jgi:hypothetical protein